MERLSSAMEQQNQEQQHQLQWRRDKVQELCSKGYSQREISQTLQVGLATVNRDISYSRNQAKSNIKKYVDERLPEEYEKCLVGLNAITKEAWNTAHFMRNEVCQQKLVKFVLNGLFRFPMYDTSKFAVLSYSCPIIVTKAIIITML